jgi:hypothetical protein
MATAADLQSTLDKLGLGFLQGLLDSLIKDPNVDVTDMNTVSNYIDTDPKSQDAIKKRFSGNETRVKNGLAPLKPAEYIAAEKEYIATLRDTGMPVGFYDSQEDLAKLIGGDVSRVELSSRIQRGYEAAMNAPQNVKQQLQLLYGIDNADLAAYYIDPTVTTDLLGRKKSATLFARQMEAAQIAAQAQQQANIALGATSAEELAAAGVSPETAQARFAEIGTQQELFRPTFGEAAVGETGISQAEQIGGVFGTNAEARRKITERRRRRQAEFEAGGGFATTQTGVTGLRTAGQ